MVLIYILMVQNNDQNDKLTPEKITTMVAELEKHINGDEHNININLNRIEPQPANQEIIAAFQDIIQKSNENPNNTTYSVVRVSYAMTWGIVIVYIPNRPIYYASLFSDNDCNFSVFSNNRQLPDYMHPIAL
jgi:hypothetical protein